jgi:hypothetical protein
MKLGTLLAAGKSLMKGQAQVSYRENRQVYLPKFGPAKNPFKPETASASGEAADVAPATTPVMPRPTRADQEPVVASAIKPLVALAQKLTAVPAMAEKKKANWAGKFSPVLIFQRVRAKGGEKSWDKADKAQKPGTQTELSLDSVKVVHNDLSDVDVEIVPMKSRSGPAEVQAPKKSWEFLGERLLRIEAS